MNFWYFFKNFKKISEKNNFLIKKKIKAEVKDDPYLLPGYIFV